MAQDWIYLNIPATLNRLGAAIGAWPQGTTGIDVRAQGLELLVNYSGLEKHILMATTPPHPFYRQ